MGVQLIERNNKNLVFSSLGEDVVLRSRELLAKSQDLMEIAQSTEQPLQGKLRLGCIPTIAPYLLSQLVCAVNQSYPNLHLLLREDTTANLLTALKTGEMDALILAMPVDIDGMSCQILGNDQFKMVVTPSLFSELPKDFRYDDFPDASIFLLEREHCLTDHAVSACQFHVSEKINPFSATSLHTLVNMVSNGLGSTFLPQIALDQGLIDNLDLIVIDPPGPKAFREIGLIWRPSSSRQSTFDALADLIKTLL